MGGRYEEVGPESIWPAVPRGNRSRHQEQEIDRGFRRTNKAEMPFQGLHEPGHSSRWLRLLRLRCLSRRVGAVFGARVPEAPPTSPQQLRTTIIASERTSSMLAIGSSLKVSILDALQEIFPSDALLFPEGSTPHALKDAARNASLKGLFCRMIADSQLLYIEKSLS